MRHASFRRAFAAAVFLAAPSLALAQGVPYALGDSANYQEGCYDPCKCPLEIAPIGGTFELTYTHADLFTAYYDVDNVDWVIGLGTQILSVKGDGTYEFGGDFALTHRLQLDLSIDGGPEQHFDSGYVIVGDGNFFPAIDITISLNGMVCFDQVFDLIAFPTAVGTPYCDNLPNSTGLPSKLHVEGSPVVFDNDFTLVAEQAPPSVPGLFFFGSGHTAQPFGDGVLCVLPPLKRIQPPAGTSAAGIATRELDLTLPPAAGAIAPGTSWDFQFWFRDGAGGPAGFNTSDGYHVSFL